MLLAIRLPFEHRAVSLEYRHASFEEAEELFRVLLSPEVPPALADILRKSGDHCLRVPIALLPPGFLASADQEIPPLLAYPPSRGRGHNRWYQRYRRTRHAGQPAGSQCCRPGPGASHLAAEKTTKEGSCPGHRTGRQHQCEPRGNKSFIRHPDGFERLPCDLRKTIEHARDTGQELGLDPIPEAGQSAVLECGDEVASDPLAAIVEPPERRAPAIGEPLAPPAVSPCSPAVTKSGQVAHQPAEHRPGEVHAKDIPLARNRGPYTSKVTAQLLERSTKPLIDDTGHRIQGGLHVGDELARASELNALHLERWLCDAHTAKLLEGLTGLPRFQSSECTRHLIERDPL